MTVNVSRSNLATYFGRLNSLITPKVEQEALIDDFIQRVQSHGLSDICRLEGNRIQWLVYLWEQGEFPQVCIPLFNRFHERRHALFKRHPERKWSDARVLKYIGALDIEIGKSQRVHTIADLTTLRTVVNDCPQRYVVVFLSIHNSKFQPNPDKRHVNILLVDKHLKTYERFEPGGALSEISAPLLKVLERSDFLTGYEYVPDLLVCPASVNSPQAIDEQDIQTYLKEHCDGLGGFCGIYALIWLHLRLSLEGKVHPRLLRTFWKRFTGAQLVDFARRYHTWIDSTQGENTDKNTNLISTFLGQTNEANNLKTWWQRLIHS
jgi:hypothetical protein